MRENRIKITENVKDTTFKPSPGRVVHYGLRFDAETNEIIYAVALVTFAADNTPVSLLKMEPGLPPMPVDEARLSAEPCIGGYWPPPRVK